MNTVVAPGTGRRAAGGANGVAVLAEGLTRAYGGRQAVTDLDLTVPAGRTFGFLGPNGAGKSTTIGMLCTLLRPTSGRALVAGYDVTHEPHEVRRRVGLVFQESTLDVDLTAMETLRFHADLFGIPRRRRLDAIMDMLELVELTERRHAPVRTFSGGMRRRLEIARGLLHTPQVLFLDEPTTGLDPQTRAAIWDHLRRLREERDVTVFLTTHQLEEAEHCDRIAIMDEGELVADGTPAALKAVVGSDLITVRTADDAAAALAVRERLGLEAETATDGLRIRVADGATWVPRICGALPLTVHAVTVTPPTLDDAFLHYTGRTIREADNEPAGLPVPASRR
ncbi:daunorubicin resistance protein DrrA family ABC transporter ATP-binding protein [Streptomyces longispororuber]|uniref:Daunorubicin resistance protein DrrA family ABC transporter ATP-binding protein n=1 Tax=Streptomyces longispororuber TaxID=68230 RepID=A0A919DQ19_9ACTN|nr:ATP-binding cassette domain-containing protein [Streptomyces longispororuber]GHE64530.1 daunorubicin resistance protein DrrA family ABC transporter ATP-binding protein [Streptomyces longispororuber]